MQVYISTVYCFMYMIHLHFFSFLIFVGQKHVVTLCNYCLDRHGFSKKWLGKVCFGAAPKTIDPRGDRSFVFFCVFDSVEPCAIVVVSRTCEVSFRALQDQIV